MKYIVVNTNEGTYKIPLIDVAKDRADYYACKLDGYEIYSREWHEEVDWVMEDDYEGIDWLINNNDWDDWESLAVKVNDYCVDDDDFWFSSDNFEIINE